jgi:DNA (cytosine-5)-methyltransferase 1
MKYKVASFFSGAGGLDLGFKETKKFQIPWANEYDKRVFATFERNFPETQLAKKSIEQVSSGEIPDGVHGFVGGPPCQSWSEAGARRGIDDPRGRLFNTYIDLLAAKQPAFFLAENVSGILFQRNAKALEDILEEFAKAGYDVYYGLLNASDYEVPQDRERVIFIGFRSDLKAKYVPPKPIQDKKNLKDALAGLVFDDAISITPGNALSPSARFENNHYFDSKHFSYIYMSRNRQRQLEECSFTIQATASYAPLHPESPPMKKIEKDKWEFTSGDQITRRLSVRECARIQTFPDGFGFEYSNVTDGYRMVGNAVPVVFAKHLANSIAEVLKTIPIEKLRTLDGQHKLKGTISRF